MSDVQTWGPDHCGEMIAANNEDYVSLSDYEFLKRELEEKAIKYRDSKTELQLKLGLKIQRLEQIISLIGDVYCAHLPHQEADVHGDVVVCPVVAKITRLKVLCGI